ncbi:MAG TPA: formimidoylglutamate deiminase [Acidimicrobiia bacterium]
MTSYWCQQAWISGQAVSSVAIEAGVDGRITAVEVGVDPGDSHCLEGLVFPGLANAHSHAFHRALRGRASTQRDFWAWREAMYRVADGLDPDSYFELGARVYREMTLAGFTAVGEFHYLHHGRGGTPYSNPNAMGEALRHAAATAGIRLTLLDTCYLEGGIGIELSPTQQRFADGSVQAWSQRRQLLIEDANTRIGAAIHSVRAVKPDDLALVADDAKGVPLHVHLSEQMAENEAAQAAFGLSPTELLQRAGALSPLSTAVHAIHLSPQDRQILGGSGATVCACPTTEADLGDGIGPFSSLARSGVPLAVGTDQHVRIDPFEEVRRLEMDQRLALGGRRHFSAADLVECLSENGYRSIGWDEGGKIAVGCLCDLVAVRTDTFRTAGADPSSLIWLAGPGDISEVVVAGRTIVSEGTHLLSAD